MNRPSADRVVAGCVRRCLGGLAMVAAMWTAMMALPARAFAQAAGSSAPMPRPPWRAFRDPLELHDSWWILLLPMSLGIAIAYKAVRNPKLERYWQSVLVLTVQIVVGMFLLGAASYVLVMVLIPRIAEIAMSWR